LVYNRSMQVSKTDFILFRECKKNVWLKIYRPDVFNAAKLSEFEKAIIETGNEVELVARTLFPLGVLIEGRGAQAQQKTQELLAAKTPILFQPEFLKDDFRAASDILELKPDDTFNLYEVKATTDVDKKTHYHDLAFQVNLLSNCGLEISNAYVVHLNSEYVRQGEVNVNKLFTVADVTETVKDLQEDVAAQMQLAKAYLQQQEEPTGHCDCVYKGRSNHCATFAYSNPTVPEYGVHDISRIGSNRARLQELIDVGIFELKDVYGREDIFNTLSDPQRNQIEAHVFDKLLIDKYSINGDLKSLVFPLYFLDYETFPAAIPRFDGFSPYQQIPFQYSLFMLDSPDSELRHAEFLFSENADPSREFLLSLQKDINAVGSIIVWNKKFECKINEELAERNKDFKPFIDMVNDRVYDLMDIFVQQYYVDKNFKGRVSIKNVLPVLVPELSYKSLEIQEGGTASQKWNKIHNGVSSMEKEKIITDLKEYCKLDTLAMVKIWEYLYKLTNV